MNIAFTLGSEKISGGTYVIFEYAIRLSKTNKVTIVTEIPVNYKNLSWHPEARKLRWSTFKTCKEKFDIAIGTWWRTIFDLPKIKARNYCYFVQSIESRFYTKPYEKKLRKLVDATYLLGMPIITEATWIKEYLKKNYDNDAYLVKNGIRKDIYNTSQKPISPKLEKGKIRILVEGPLKVSFKNTVKALKLANKSKADEIWLLTSDKIKKHKYADKVFSQVPIFETPKIYRSCDLIVKLSYVEGMFGPPLEMFHCGGTAIVYNVTGHDEYIKNNYNGIVIKKDDEKKVIAKINYLKEHPQSLNQFKKNALNTASNWYSWDDASIKFEHSLKSIIKNGTINQSYLKNRCNFYFNWYITSEKIDINLIKHLWQKIIRRTKNFIKYLIFKMNFYFNWFILIIKRIINKFKFVCFKILRKIKNIIKKIINYN